MSKKWMKLLTNQGHCAPSYCCCLVYSWMLGELFFMTKTLLCRARQALWLPWKPFSWTPLCCLRRKGQTLRSLYAPGQVNESIWVGYFRSGSRLFFAPKEKVALLLAFGAHCCGAGKRLLLSLLPDWCARGPLPGHSGCLCKPLYMHAFVSCTVINHSLGCQYVL